MTAKIKLNAASGGGSVSLQAPTSTTNNENIELKLPVADGTSGQALTTNASGQLAFATISSNPTTTSGTDNFTVADGNLVIGTAGHGIDFSATADGSGSNQAELLDDYEEGTWTPTINVGTFSGFVTFRYTKIGNFVKVNGGLIFNNTSSSTEVQISGLPFAGNGDQFTGTVWLRRTSTGDKKYISTIGQSGASIISYQHDSNGNDMGGAIAYSNFQNSSTYNNFSISYFTNS